MKKLINKIENVITEQMEGMAAAHSSIKINLEPKYIYRSEETKKGKVVIISGGGSGHEPMHGGFVGLGMLDAACPGEVFTSPTPDQMFECAKKVENGGGVLFLVKNYTGDVMNFEMAAEMLNADGIKTQNILIDDDVAVKDSLYTAGRRGVGTTVIMEKIVGAAAEAGYDLEQCAALAKKVNSRGRSMGMALTSCIVPAAGKPNFDIDEDEIEIGVGIHGEPGRKRIPLTNADEITTILTSAILDDKAYSRPLREWDFSTNSWVEKELTSDAFKAGDQMIALVNGLGSTPVSELYTVYRKFNELCEAKNITIARNLVGSYITALDMQGCSITLVRADDEMIKLWDAPVNTAGLKM
ncbi:dihydroxyacetone kinase DhaK subunit [Roseivirga ehrenbergii]|uniref:Dihydroxyacetone kinase n=1 Tax=Roseivirga ehrenbergii (strain DSM 102268 / JCM 13514 / KCTC 12282 / NCIMB 14502 / KMM 6017) TaxID=279360 RepID=A0A150X7D1_ROSEK|nr:dihydroxyacetone kinase subunit DhaK [Roseivirga ehrenbergii]KYG74647.1 dihydroxyacetone kinase [Roseivirga ehrenbergii]TCL14031.1 dihydroxyacetone kinase DhaK subunit [Roseivirga ehrenbergii]